MKKVAEVRSGIADAVRFGPLVLSVPALRVASEGRSHTLGGINLEHFVWGVAAGGVQLGKRVPHIGLGARVRDDVRVQGYAIVQAVEKRGNVFR
jgi:hypothetical protein